MAGSHRGVRIVDWSTESKRLAFELASFALVECAPLSEYAVVRSKKGGQEGFSLLFGG